LDFVLVICTTEFSTFWKTSGSDDTEEEEEEDRRMLIVMVKLAVIAQQCLMVAVNAQVVRTRYC